jgi:cell growth-regulating nucleolar protein
MRTWGSAAASPAPEAIQAANGNVAVDAPAPTVPVFESKASKNKKKKDKKGTGSRANTRNPPGAESTAEPEAAPAANPAKKRKAEDSPEPASSATPVEVTDDLRKRLRKNVAKLDGVSGIELSLEEWVEKVKGKKDKVGGTDGVLRGVKVVWQGEGWALSV